jgi:hypothetical protein
MADAAALNAMATPHNPAPTTAAMLTRLKVVIDVDPFIHAQTFRSTEAAAPACRIEVALMRPRQYQQQIIDNAPRRTAPFPNGDPFEHGWTPFRAAIGLKGIAQHQRTGSTPVCVAESLPTRVALVIRRHPKVCRCIQNPRGVSVPSATGITIATNQDKSEVGER